MRKIVLAFSALGLLAASAPSIAAQCRDPNGHFVKCTVKAPMKVTKCRDAKGHFAKCGTPGAKPA